MKGGLFEHTNYFLDALSQYKSDLDRGEYETLAEYTQEQWKWTDLEVINFLEKALVPFLSELSIPGVTSDNIRAKLESELPISFPQIISLITSLDLLKNKNLGAELLDQLDTEEISVQVDAAIPGPCLAKIIALRRNVVINDQKFGSLDSMILKIIKNIEELGVLGHLTLKIAIQDWLKAYEKLTPAIQKNFLSDKNKYLALANEDKSQEALTLVEEYCLLSLKELSDDINLLLKNYPLKGPDYSLKSKCNNCP